MITSYFSPGFRFSSKDLIGTVTVDLADADLLGICTNAAIERVLNSTRVSCIASKTPQY